MRTSGTKHFPNSSLVPYCHPKMQQRSFRNVRCLRKRQRAELGSLQIWGLFLPPSTCHAIASCCSLLALPRKRPLLPSQRLFRQGVETVHSPAFPIILFFTVLHFRGRPRPLESEFRVTLVAAHDANPGVLLIMFYCCQIVKHAPNVLCSRTNGDESLPSCHFVGSGNLHMTIRTVIHSETQQLIYIFLLTLNIFERL